MFKDRRGGSTVLSVIAGLGLITFMLFFPIVSFSLLHKQNLLEDCLTVGLQMVSVEGGLTEEIEQVLIANMRSKGLIPEPMPEGMEERIIFKSNADIRLGDEQRRYRDSADPGITLEIIFPADVEVGLINALSRIIGATKETVPFKDGEGAKVVWNYTFKGYILSEKVDY